MIDIIRIKNTSDKSLSVRVTRVPLSNPMKSPKPAMVFDPQHPGEKIPNPALLTKADDIALRGGEVVEFKGGDDKEYNLEQGELIYRMFGSPEDGGSTYPGGPRTKNKNFIIEVNEKGEEIKTNLFKKYRMRNTTETAKNVITVEKEK
jgi:hypothetical protein